MNEFLSNAYDYIMLLISSSSFWGPILACLLIFVESLLPVLPLFVFITIVFVSYGYIFGFIISYILTSLGCMFSFFLCRKVFKNLFEKKVRKYKMDKLMKKIDDMDVGGLALLVAIPFTPAFLVNIAAALSKMEFKKFALSIIIGKISLVVFWGFIGTSLLESLKNPKILIIVIFMMAVAYIISKEVAKRLNIK